MTRRRRAIALTLILSAGLLTGCETTSTTLVGTDVPTISGMTEVRATNVAISGDRMIRGNFTLHGPCDDAEAALEQAADRMLQRGWTREGIDAGPDHAVGTFVKDDRTCQIEIRRRPDDPGRSTASIEVHSAM